MDELTIGDKIYVSSKKAAKITGYAKDYVGQLCREGRVEARLVGRNWYVLESSLMEHRFGAESHDSFETPVSEGVTEQESAPESQVSAPEVEQQWPEPVYRREEPVLVPLVSKEPYHIEESKQVVSDMQTAWQEWFATQKKAQESVREVVEEDPTYLPSEDTYEEQTSEPVMTEAPREIPESFQPEEQIPLTIHREAVLDIAEHYEEHGGDVIDLTKPQVVHEVVESKTMRTFGTSLALRALFIVVAGLALVTALIGTGALGHIVSLAGTPTGAQKAIIDYLGGESTYKSISK